MKKRLIFIIAIAAIVALGIFARPQKQEVHAEDTRMVTVHVDGETKTIATNAPTVHEVLKKLGVQMGEHDKTEPVADTSVVGADFTINLYRARPIAVVDGFNRYQTVTAERSPKEIAEDAGVYVHPEDDFSFRRSDESVDGLPTTEMVIKRAKIINTRQEEIPFTEEKEQDSNQPTSYKQIKRAGQNGKKLITYEVLMQNGVEIGQIILKEEIIQAPLSQQLIVGSKVATNDFSGSLEEWLRILRTCETGGNYQRNSGNGYYGAYQFLPSTWNRTAAAIGRQDLVGVMPHEASPADQDVMVIANANRSSAGLASQHPGCYQKHGLSAKPPQ